MKQTKIIAPALAIIAFSTAASIAGSVAWFTASRQVTINAGSYAVVKTNSDLTYTMAAGVGTTVNTTSNTVTFNGLLTHGSFNHLTQKVYTPSGDGKSLAKETALTANDFATQMVVTTIDTDTVYTAATFDITFTINFGAGEGDKGLFLNNTASQSSFAVDGGADPVTAKGFRMAIVPKTIPTGSAGAAKVLADLQSSSNCLYVAGMDNYDGTAYTTDLMDKDFDDALPDSTVARATATARPDYLGTIKAPTSGSTPTVSLTYTVVAWFDGNDPTIVTRANAADYQKVISKLVFDAVDLKAA